LRFAFFLEIVTSLYFHISAQDFLKKIIAFLVGICYNRCDIISFAILDVLKNDAA